MASHTAKRTLFALPRILALRRAQVALEDHLRLKAEHDHLRTQVARLQKQVETVTEDLHLQFIRIAHMQAGLDEDRRISRNSGANLPREGVPPDVNHDCNRIHSNGWDHGRPATEHAPNDVQSGQTMPALPQRVPCVADPNALA
jgi:hypothetical protein